MVHLGPPNRTLAMPEFKGGSLHDGFGGFDDFGGSGDTLPSFCWSYKIQDKEALTVLAVMAVLVVTATPPKLNPPFPSS